ncbi:MAG: hypothetical protein EYC70_14270 [Planctomycetota bacterium]|nr:MAG: hypothetical protein EYC70_14270 [Planctomycetota bacterium]
MKTRLLAFLPLLTLSGLVTGAAAQDFNGDQRTDLVVGVPHEDVGAVANAGAVNVYYADPSGHISTAGAQVWDQSVPGLGELAEAGDQFGAAVAWGDMNGDGYDDLAIGVPYEDTGNRYFGKPDAGLVHVLFGSLGGLTAGGALRYTEANYWSAEVEAGDCFGFSLAMGDVFDQGYQGLADLVVGAPFEDIDGVIDAGAVFTFPSPFAPSSWYPQMWSQGNGLLSGSPPGAYDRFGWTLALAEYSPFLPWLAIGIPFEDVNGRADAGAVQILYYDTALKALNTGGQQFWTQDSSGILDTAEVGDNFGYSLATGYWLYDSSYFNGRDLAVGVPGEDVGSAADAGAVSMIYYAEAYGRLDWYANQFVSQAMSGMPDPAEAGDAFGTAVAQARELSGFTDLLVVGIPGEGIGSASAAGAVILLHAGSTGIRTANSSFLHQDSTGLLDAAEANDRFGTTLYGGIYFDGFLAAVGVPLEDVNGISDAGAVQVLYGGSSNEFWHQDVAGAPDACEAADDFGLGLPPG